MADDDVAGSLIAALGNEGEYVDDGRFTLDAVKAQAKLRDYQLVDPHGYLLLLVEAAWLATRGRRQGSRACIDIKTGATTTVVLDGVSLPAHALGNLFGAALGDATGLDGDRERARILQLLGLAANSALALEPRRLTIEVVDPKGRLLRAEITADDVEVEATDDEPPETAEIRFEVHGSRLDLDRPGHERELVRERCRLTSLEVRVDGERVSKGPRVDLDEGEGPSLPVMLDDAAIGVVGFSEGFAVAKGHIVNRAVEVEAPRIRGPEGLVAVVEVDLPMDLSRSQLQRGEQLERVEAAIARTIASLPRDHTRINWRAVQTGDAAMFATLGIVGVLVVALFGLMIYAVALLVEGG